MIVPYTRGCIPVNKVVAGVTGAINRGSASMKGENRRNGRRGVTQYRSNKTNEGKLRRGRCSLYLNGIALHPYLNAQQ